MTDEEILAALAAGQDLVAASIGAVLRRDIRSFADAKDEHAFWCLLAARNGEEIDWREAPVTLADGQQFLVLYPIYDEAHLF